MAVMFVAPLLMVVGFWLLLVPGRPTVIVFSGRSTPMVRLRLVLADCWNDASAQRERADPAAGMPCRIFGFSESAASSAWFCLCCE
jgi:hypothetical protein